MLNKLLPHCVKCSQVILLSDGSVTRHLKLLTGQDVKVVSLLLAIKHSHYPSTCHTSIQEARLSLLNRESGGEASL